MYVCTHLTSEREKAIFLLLASASFGLIVDLLALAMGNGLQSCLGISLGVAWGVALGVRPIIEVKKSIISVSHVLGGTRRDLSDATGVSGRSPECPDIGRVTKPVLPGELSTRRAADSRRELKNTVREVFDR